jgi:hypothetical protein
LRGSSQAPDVNTFGELLAKPDCLGPIVGHGNADRSVVLLDVHLVAALALWRRWYFVGPQS